MDTVVEQVSVPSLIRSKKEFTHKGTEVTELVIGKAEDVTVKLAWALTPWDKFQIDGKNNPLFHAEYTPDPEQVTERIARKRVQEAFDKHWRL